jgi:DNA repair exonuclease SbcCD ATPase subunit
MIYDLADEMSVEFTFTHNKQVILVNRSVKRDKGQKLRVWIDGIEKTERLLGKNQDTIDKALGMSYELVLSTSVAQQDEINILSEMGPTDREKIISEMLQIETWEKKKKAIASVIEKTKDLLESISATEKEIAIDETAVIMLRADLEDHNKELATLRTSQNFVTEKLTKLSEDLKRFEEYSKIRGAHAIASGLVIGIENQLKTMQPVNEEEKLKIIEALKEGTAENKSLVTEIQAKLLDLQKIQKEAATELAQAKLLASLEPQTKILDTVPCVGLEIHDRCELLKQAAATKLQISTTLWEYGHTSLTGWVDRIKERQQTAEQHKTSLETSLANIQSIINKTELKLIQEIHTLEAANERDRLCKEHDKYLNDKQALEKQLTSTPQFNAQEFNEFQEKHKFFQEKIHSIELDIARQKTALTSLYEPRIQKNKDNLTALRLRAEQQANYVTLHRAYNEITSLLFEEAIPYIEQYTNEILEKVSPGKRVQLRSFKDTKAGTQTKSLDVVGMTATGNRDFDNLSGSEKFRQSLALRIAIARYNKERNNVTIDFFVVDEGFGSLDAENRVQAKAALKDIASRFDLFLIITHVGELQDTFDNKILINPQVKT